MIRTSSSGAAARATLLLVIAFALALLMGVLVWLERSSDGASTLERGTTSGSSESDGSLVGAQDGRARSAAGDGIVLAEAGFAIPVGVRLRGDGRLEGRVVERASAAPVAGARVDLLVVPPAGRDLLGKIFRVAKFGEDVARRVEPAAVAASGPDGRFAFEGVRSGRYFVDARAARHCADGLAQVIVAPSGSGGPVDVFVRAGGRVLGRVHDASGAGIAGAKVALHAGPGSFMNQARTGELRSLEATTAFDGTFLIAGVPPGDAWELGASGAGTTLSHVTAISVRIDLDTHVDLELRAGARVVGSVLAPRGTADDTSAPVAGAHVVAVPRGLRDLYFTEEVFLSTHARTDASGRYLLDDVPPGECDVIAYAPGYLLAKGALVRVAEAATAEAAPIVLSRGPSVRLRVIDGSGQAIAGVQASWWVVDWKSFEFEFSLTPFLLQGIEGFSFPTTDARGELVAGPFPSEPPFHIYLGKAGFDDGAVEWRPEDGAELVITLKRGGSVEGIVMDEERSEPVPRFSVGGTDRLELDPEAPASFNPFSGDLLVENQEGLFRVECVRPGVSTLVFSAPGYLSTTIDAIPVREGETTRGIIVKLKPGGRVKGRVVDERGAGIAGAQVLAADARGRPLVEWERSRDLGGNTKNAQQNQEFALGLMDFAAGLGAQSPALAFSGADGSFELEGLAPGMLVVLANHRNFAPGRSVAIDLGERALREGIEVRLAAGGGLYGLVEDRHGRAVPGVIVVAFDTARTQPGDPRALSAGYESISDASGNYRIEHMAAGTYFVAAVRGDEALTPSSFLGTLNFDLVSVPAGVPTRNDVLDSSAGGARVFGRITAHGEAIGRGSVLAFGFESENMLGLDVKIASVREEGTYEFAGLAPGAYRFVYQGAGPEVKFDVEVPDLPEWRLDLEMPRGEISGRVVDSTSGASVAGAVAILARPAAATTEGLLASFFSKEGGRERGTTGEGGEFSFARLQAGEYELSVMPPTRGEFSQRYAPSETRRVRVGEGEEVDGIIFALEPALEIHGIVRSVEGLPIALASVSAWPMGGSGSIGTNARSDADGRFVLRSLARSRHGVAASARGYADSAPLEIDLAEGSADEIELVLEEGVIVIVFVRRSDGSPVQGATGRLVRSEGAVQPDGERARRTVEGFFRGEGVSDPAGRLDLGRHALGTYRLEVSRGERLVTREGVRVEGGSRAELEVVLE